ncbi:alpha/beta hydrolase fold domain-containing protein [Brachybacterium sp. EF45031]|uniref:alpha/beta hydrolase n=1 Tax=Brachybacterium sillae TaxID=2810536 RepID=UPI00217F0DB8|nr:alpha/beta hydrolase [Brachybacterium sillae]MCS6712032.1 alpha/beta hydrolase fold domain-containing protein [Brachybacterium sillae]
MGRIADIVTTGARAVRNAPVPGPVYTQGLAEARRALPPGRVQKKHAVDVEMIDRTRCVWLDRHLAAEGVIVHLHGGAYVSGPFGGDWEWLSAQAEARRCAGLMIDYRVGPDHQHPVALEDTEAALRELVARGVLGEGCWVLSGTDAGGGLAMVLAHRHWSGGSHAPALPRPAGLLIMAAWMDLELANPGITETGRRDPVHERRLLRAAAAAYAGRTPLDDPELSPANADLSGLPPVHLSVGTRDLFLTEDRVLRLHLEENGVQVRYREVNGRLGGLPWMRRGEDTARLLREQAQFIGSVIGRR